MPSNSVLIAVKCASIRCFMPSQQQCTCCCSRFNTIHNNTYPPFVNVS